MGTIQRQIGQVDEAVSSFTEALALAPESSLALEGAGEAYLAQAHARTSEGLYTAATIALRSGCEATRRFLASTNASLAAAASTATEASRGECAWKLLGDLYTYAHKLPPMCFEGEGAREGHGQQGGEGYALGLGTKEAAEHQAVSVRVWARRTGITLLIFKANQLKLTSVSWVCRSHGAPLMNRGVVNRGVANQCSSSHSSLCLGLDGISQCSLLILV